MHGPLKEPLVGPFGFLRLLWKLSQTGPAILAVAKGPQSQYNYYSIAAIMVLTSMEWKQ